MWQRLLRSTVVFLLSIEVLVLCYELRAATCTADCGGGRSVSCSGDSCGARDGVGCASFDAEGRETLRKSCAEPHPE